MYIYTYMYMYKCIYISIYMYIYIRRRVWWGTPDDAFDQSDAFLSSQSASRRRGNHSKGFGGFYVKATARIWP